MQRSVSTGDVVASWSSTRRVHVADTGRQEQRLEWHRAGNGKPNRRRAERQRASDVDAIDSESSASARPTLHVIGSDTNAGRCAPVGAVERAFASVRIVEANVCKGGEWLVRPKDDVQECDCVVVDESGYVCGEGCINRAVDHAKW
ncbi:hypothetical protein PF001_g47 [Phytophthora fragariae]|uniref:Uncharacterized protein n=1 Tax=Phytophthora fragariae TaxID=53985 RepID=A0A6A4EX73_9STRA|nr:hypothetical protein PF009_g18 [Phytophthora fragariae]KAE9331086.1 hypothetical protein PF001_g47 [Phytophthora fragariae]